MPRNRKSQGKQKVKHSIENLTKSEIEELIEEIIVGRNAERDRKITRRRLIDGICYEPLAEEFGISPAQTKRIVYKAVAKILKELK